MGFEPMIRFPVYTISSRAPSAKLGHLSSTTMLIISTTLIFVNVFLETFYIFCCFFHFLSIASLAAIFYTF